MFEVITKWNLLDPNKEMKDTISEIKLRGYTGNTFLTGEFARKIKNKEIKALSVNTLVGKYCPTRRDLYFEKGITHLTDMKTKETWGRKVGYVLEGYQNVVFNNKKIGRKYDELIKSTISIDEKFKQENKLIISKLKSLEKSSYGIRDGATEWLQVLLSSMGRAELALKFLHDNIKDMNSLDGEHIGFKQKITTNPTQIGISSPAEPDFIMPKFGIVGDWKSGTEFISYYLLTCTAYALAYENQYGKGNDINWGIIYFFPTRNKTEFVKPLTFAQIYIFPIDDRLREWFINFRDEAYNIISKSAVPDFPAKNDRENCFTCSFKDYCKEKGLVLENE